jgi:hypothetical protein
MNFDVVFGIGTSLGIRSKMRGERAPELLICADVINLLGEEINTTKGNTASLLRVDSNSVLELRAGKTKCLNFLSLECRTKS